MDRINSVKFCGISWQASILLGIILAFVQIKMLKLIKVPKQDDTVWKLRTSIYRNTSIKTHKLVIESTPKGTA